MQKLFGRNNIICKSYDGKDIYIYEDHRTVLNILWAARETGIFSNPPTVVCFDKHDDFKNSAVDENKIALLNDNSPSKEEFWSFTEWDLSPLDDDWIKTGMELNLIGSVILIGAEIKRNISGLSNSYTDRDGKEHFLYSLAHIWKGFAPEGWLVDLKRPDLFQPVWDLLGWRHSDKGFYFDAKTRKAKLVLDFDLDCFSDELHGYTVAWRDDIFFNLFNKPFDKYDYTPKDFLVSLFKESTFTTIAKESECFSYINESDTVFKCLNEILFNNRL